VRILLVAHGANHSTYDIYRYYAKALADAGVDLTTFPYHMAMDYHHRAIVSMYPEMTEGDVLHKTVLGASRDIISQAVLSQPEHILFVGGLAVPQYISAAVYNMRSLLKTSYRVGYIFTESPYQDDEQEFYMNYSDYAFFNDKYSAEAYNPDGELYVEYLPHSYAKEVHYPYHEIDNQEHDVVFCGTLYPERVNFFNRIDWTNINVKMIGNYSDSDTQLTLNNNRFVHGTLNNIQLAELYRNSKLAINFHRHAENAYSANPRIREAVMCGCLPISDYRKEIEDVFGDSIPFVSNSDETSDAIRNLLDNPEERKNRLSNAQKCIMNKESYDNRVNDIILPLLREVGE